MIGGEPGVGKTRLTEELVREARDRGCLTLEESQETPTPKGRPGCTATPIRAPSGAMKKISSPSGSTAAYPHQSNGDGARLPRRSVSRVRR